MPNPVPALWVSHSSISDFMKCPRAYYLKNVYRNPDNGRKICLMQPSLALGQAVHAVLEGLSLLPLEERFGQPLTTRFVEAWSKVSGKAGGFYEIQEEDGYRERGLAMVARVEKNPGPLAAKALNFRSGKLPRLNLDDADGIILCGRVDWIEYLPDSNGVHIIDFKSGIREERPDSLQLPIYYLLVAGLKKRTVERASYWYLERDDQPVEVALPDPELAVRRVLTAAREIKRARSEGRLDCPRGGCYACRPYEEIVAGRAEFVGLGEFEREIYILPRSGQWEEEVESEMAI